MSLLEALIAAKLSGSGGGGGAINPLPEATAADNGKFLRVVNGSWAAEDVPSAESEAY